MSASENSFEVVFIINKKTIYVNWVVKVFCHIFINDPVFSVMSQSWMMVAVKN